MKRSRGFKTFFFFFWVLLFSFCILSLTAGNLFFLFHPDFFLVRFLAPFLVLLFAQTAPTSGDARQTRLLFSFLPVLSLSAPECYFLHLRNMSSNSHLRGFIFHNNLNRNALPHSRVFPSCLLSWGSPGCGPRLFPSRPCSVPISDCLYHREIPAFPGADIPLSPFCLSLWESSFSASRDARVFFLDVKSWRPGRCAGVIFFSFLA